MEQILNGITIVISVALMGKYWFLGKGYEGFRKLCTLQIGISVLQLVYNAILIHIHPALWATYLFQSLILWSIIMSIKGLRRTREK